MTTDQPDPAGQFADPGLIAVPDAAAETPLQHGPLTVPLLGDAILGQARDAWTRLGADLPLRGIDLASMFLPDRAGDANPAPVLVVMARGVTLGDAGPIMSWSALPGWILSQRDVDLIVGKMCGGVRAEKNRQLRAGAPGLNGGRPV